MSLYALDRGEYDKFRSPLNATIVNLVRPCTIQTAPSPPAGLPQAAEHGTDTAFLDTTESAPRLNFATLPEDIHHLIRRELPIDALVQLSMTNRAFWEFNKTYIAERLRAVAGSWAGSRIITNSQWNWIGVEEMKEKAASEDIIAADDLKSPFERSSRHNLVLAKKKFRKSKEFASYTAEQMEIYNACFRLAWQDYYSKDRVWLFRNLTLKEYVRSDVIALRPDFAWRPFIAGVGFENILEFKSSFPPPAASTIGCGDWAGHQFDIIVLEMHQDEIIQKGEVGMWTDESQRIFDEWMTNECVWEQADTTRNSIINQHEFRKARDPYYMLHEAGGRPFKNPPDEWDTI